MKYIDLGMEYSCTLTSRSIIREIESQYGDELLLDFKNVDFISRSFAHELILCINKNPQIRIINANQNIQKMLNVVKKSLNKKRSITKISRENIMSAISH